VNEETRVSSGNPENEVGTIQDQVPSPPTAIDSSGQEPSTRETSKPTRRRRRRRRRKVDLSRVQPGQQYEGRVVGLAKFGAFVDIGVGRDGLIHISEMGEGFVDEVGKVLSIGDEVTVWVKSVDRERKRISLTMIEPRGRRLSLQDLEPGMVLTGTVEGVANFGAFVDIGAPVKGLVHVSEMAEGYVRSPQSIVSPGDDVKVRVLEVDPQDMRISLSMKGFHTSRAPSASSSEEEKGPFMTAIQLAWQRALAAKKRGEGEKKVIG